VQASGEKTSAQFAKFLEDALGLLAEHSADGAIHFVCTDWRHLDEMLTAGRRVYRELKNLVVWNKTNAGMGSFYRSQHELIFVWKHGRGKHINNIELGQHGRNRSNVWTYAGANVFGADRLDEVAMHPTVKPVALVADALRDCSRRGDLVLDSFGGSGTTLIACERTNRQARLIELDPIYCDQIVRRWQKLTGATPAGARNGFAEPRDRQPKSTLPRPQPATETARAAFEPAEMPANCALFVRDVGSHRTAWWAWEDSKLQPDHYEWSARPLAACFSILMDEPECGALVGPGERNALEQIRMLGGAAGGLPHWPRQCQVRDS